VGAASGGTEVPEIVINTKTDDDDGDEAARDLVLDTSAAGV
jgi:hypothetical protein